MNDDFLLLGPNPYLATQGEQLTKLPVQFEVTIETNDYKADLITVKAYGAVSGDAEAIANFARRLKETFYAPMGDGE